jgi:hypothetical protein
MTRETTEAKSEWQEQGGTLTIPDGCFLMGADFDCAEPWIGIMPVNQIDGESQKIKVPKTLAYFLSVHYCGSESMAENLRHQGRVEVKGAAETAIRVLKALIAAP